MSEIGKASIHHLMQASTQALYDCQESINSGEAGKNTQVSPRLPPSQQTHLLLQLMETLVDTKNQLTNVIESNRVRFLDPKIVKEMEEAIQNVIVNPLDSKINQIYLATFGYNSPLWHVLKEMQKLLQTVEFLKEPRGRRVAKVQKKNRERRKKRDEKDTLIQEIQE